MVWRGMSMINMYSINAIMFRARCGPLKKTVLSYGMFFPALWTPKKTHFDIVHLYLWTPLFAILTVFTFLSKPFSLIHLMQATFFPMLSIKLNRSIFKQSPVERSNDACLLWTLKCRNISIFRGILLSHAWAYDRNNMLAPMQKPSHLWQRMKTTVY